MRNLPQMLEKKNQSTGNGNSECHLSRRNDIVWRYCNSNKAMHLLHPYIIACKYKTVMKVVGNLVNVSEKACVKTFSWCFQKTKQTKKIILLAIIKTLFFQKKGVEVSWLNKGLARYYEQH